MLEFKVYNIAFALALVASRFNFVIQLRTGMLYDW